ASDKRRLGEFLLLRDVLHPLIIACGGEHTDGGGIPGERFGGEGGDLGDSHKDSIKAKGKTQNFKVKTQLKTRKAEVQMITALRRAVHAGAGGLPFNP